jgi:hypothetical protein
MAKTAQPGRWFTAGLLHILNDGEITSSTFAEGNAGTVQVVADQLLIDGAGAEGLPALHSSAPPSGGAGHLHLPHFRRG